MLITPMTEKAMAIAMKAHAGQVDKSGNSYVQHPARVASGFQDEELVCVALLHDVVEDSDMTLENIRQQGFSDRVCDALAAMTHDKNVPYMDYIREIAKNPAAKAVKLADLADNLNPARMKKLDSYTRERLQKKYLAAQAYLLGEQAETPESGC